MNVARAVDGASARPGFSVAPCRAVVLSGLVQASVFCHNDISSLPQIVAVWVFGDGLSSCSRAIVLGLACQSGAFVVGWDRSVLNRAF